MAQTKPAFDETMLRIARDSARSVYDTIRDSVEEDEAFARWQTADFFSNEMVYQPYVYTGTASVALFLADYGCAFADSRAFELASKALAWVESADNDASVGAVPGTRSTNCISGTFSPVAVSIRKSCSPAID